MADYERCPNNDYSPYDPRAAQDGTGLMGKRGPKSLPIEAKYAANTEWRGECLIWTGALRTDGYGQVWHNGRTYAAHRLAWILANGQPNGFILHSCDNRQCVNLAHLRAGTHQDNMNDAKVRGRIRHGRWLGILGQVHTLKAQGKTVYAICKELGVSRMSVKRRLGHDRTRGMPEAHLAR